MKVRIRNFYLIERRRRLGLSHEDVAKKAGICTHSYINHEGMRVNAHFRGDWTTTAKKIAKALSSKPEDLWPQSIRILGQQHVSKRNKVLRQRMSYEKRMHLRAKIEDCRRKRRNREQVHKIVAADADTNTHKLGSKGGRPSKYESAPIDKIKALWASESDYMRFRNLAPDEIVWRRELAQQIIEALPHLPDRQFYAVTRRYFEQRTLDDIGKSLRVSRERSRQLSEEGLNKILKILRNTKRRMEIIMGAKKLQIRKWVFRYGPGRCFVTEYLHDDSSTVHFVKDDLEAIVRFLLLRMHIDDDNLVEPLVSAYEIQHALRKIWAVTPNEVAEICKNVMKTKEKQEN